MNIGTLTLVIVGASCIGTLVGFGTNTILEPILLTTVSEPFSFLLGAIIHASGGLSKVLLFWRHIDKKLAIGFGIPAMISTIVGSILLLELPFASVPHYLGWFLLLYVVFVLLNPKITYSPTAYTILFGGVVTGFLAGLFGIRGAVQAAFLSNYDISVERYIATTGAISLSVDIVRIIVYIIGGLRLSYYQSLGMVLFIPASFFGVLLAQRIVPYIDQKLSKKIVAAALIVFSGYLIFTGGRSA